MKETGMTLELNERVAIVTGAAQGIGEATARKLAERGAHVAGIDVQGERLKQAMASIAGAEAVTLDVTDAGADERMIREIHERLGRIDILVNVAGGTLGATPGIDGLSIEEWRRVLALNLDAPFFLSRAVAPLMKARGWGRIITVGSGAGRSVSRTHIVPYAVAKAGVHGLMRQLAVELAPFGVLCNAVAPGLILTPLGREHWDDYSEERKRADLSSIAVGRTGEPEEIANMIAFLASEEASYIAGQTLEVDGGHWMF
jgi:3-oxoacyl-[acyl-carrier protein] reductase